MTLGLVAVWGKSRSLVPALAGLALSLAAAGCGGDGGGACGLTPCGGDVVGTWQASTACIDKATLNMEFLAALEGSCPDVALGNVSMTPSGTVAFTADMMFTSTLSVDSTIDIIFPAACTGGASCPVLGAALQGALVGTNGVTGATCTGSSACTCTLAVTTNTFDDTGTWATAGTTLTVTGATSAETAPTA